MDRCWIESWNYRADKNYLESAYAKIRLPTVSKENPYGSREFLHLSSIAI
jgi:hypothetical protein